MLQLIGTSLHAATAIFFNPKNTSAFFSLRVKKARSRGWLNRGFSFLEILITGVILAVGFVAVYRAFFLSLGYLHHMNYRLQANILLESKIAELDRLFKRTKTVATPFNNEVKSIKSNNRMVDFGYTLSPQRIDDLENIYQLDVSLQWQEGARPISLKRSIYIAHFDEIEKKE